ncbi:hypothetical protein QYF36_018139 [Acer negundo]|nr:hypothetical protein QYF36_018139 [Acer negundo]
MNSIQYVTCKIQFLNLVWSLVDNGSNDLRSLDGSDGEEDEEGPLRKFFKKRSLDGSDGEEDEEGPLRKFFKKRYHEFNPIRDIAQKYEPMKFSYHEVFCGRRDKHVAVELLEACVLRISLHNVEVDNHISFLREELNWWDSLSWLIWHTAAELLEACALRIRLRNAEVDNHKGFLCEELNWWDSISRLLW